MLTCRFAASGAVYPPPCLLVLGWYPRSKIQNARTKRAELCCKVIKAFAEMPPGTFRCCWLYYVTSHILCSLLSSPTSTVYSSPTGLRKPREYSPSGPAAPLGWHLISTAPASWSIASGCFAIGNLLGNRRQPGVFAWLRRISPLATRRRSKCHAPPCCFRSTWPLINGT